MGIETGPKPSTEELKRRLEKIKSNKAKEGLEKIPQISEKEIEEKIFSIKGVEKGKDWEKAKKYLREKGKE